MEDDESEVSHTRLAYLPGLDGVRAAAVLAVMMFHGGIPFMNGGFMGVDAFFVLSGFLITSLLVGEWRQSLTIRLGSFWARRARRLLPALLLMLLFVAFFASVIVPKGTYSGLRLDALSTLLYVSNWHFILVGSNYFNETASASPLIHTWSLAVEEQFYLVWPLVVLGVLHFAKSLKVLLAVCVVAAVASALEMYLLFRHATNINRAYLGTDTRSQCLFIGCALAVGLVIITQSRHEDGRLAKGELWRPATSTGVWACALVGIAGAAGAVLIWVLTSESSSFPYSGGFFLVGLCTAGVILSTVGAPCSLVPRFLSLTPIRYVGRISYGIYIWHWPLFLWIDHARTGLTGYPLFALRVAVTLVVSVLSFHLVERPIRMGTFLDQWRAWVAVPVAVVVVVAALLAATVGTTAGAGTAAPASPTHAPPTLPPPSTAGPPVRVMLLGDSTALTLGLGMSFTTIEKVYGYVLFNDAIVGCGLVTGLRVELLGNVGNAPSACNGSPLTPHEPLLDQPLDDQWRSELNTDKPNVTVLLAGRWEETNREYEGKWTNILQPAFAAYVKQRLESTSNLITASGSNVVFLTAPCTDEGEQPNGAPWPEDDPARNDEYNKLVRQVAALHPATDSVIDLKSLVCPGGKFATSVDGEVVRRSDGVHFTLWGSVFLAPYLLPGIVASGRAQMAKATPGTTTTTVPPPPGP